LKSLKSALENDQLDFRILVKSSIKPGIMEFDESLVNGVENTFKELGFKDFKEKAKLADLIVSGHLTPTVVEHLAVLRRDFEDLGKLDVFHSSFHSHTPDRKYPMFGTLMLNLTELKDRECLVLLAVLQVVLGQSLDI